MVRASTFAGNYPLNGAKTFAAASTVDYAATSVNQTVANNLTYGTLRISGGLTKTLSGNLPALLTPLPRLRGVSSSPPARSTFLPSVPTVRPVVAQPQGALSASRTVRF